MCLPVLFSPKALSYILEPSHSLLVTTNCQFDKGLNRIILDLLKYHGEVLLLDNVSGVLDNAKLTILLNENAWSLHFRLKFVKEKKKE